MLRPGERVGDWIVDDVLGEGGMGAVYRVHSALTERLEAALKVMKPTLGAEARARFVREAEALSMLRHPAIVHVMGFTEDPARGLLYLVMELAHGETLKARLERGAMSLPEVVGTFGPLASALEHAHNAGIFHRDLKPANIILCTDGSLRLVDFGIAAAQQGEALTTTGHVGTLSYLPPEVFRGQPAGPRAIDVYGFGVLLYEALMGTRVFPVEPGMTPAAAAASVGVRKLQQPALELPASFPETLREHVRLATGSDPELRPDMTRFRHMFAVLTETMGLPMSAAAAEATPAPSGLASVMRAEERTTRVPDPPSRYEAASATGTQRPRGADRRRASRGRPQSLGWIVAAVVLSALVLGVFVRSVRHGSEVKGPEPAPVASAAPPSLAPQARPTQRPLTLSASPVVVSPPAAALPPSAPLAASAEPALRPSPTPAPTQPSLRPSPMPAPVQPAAVPRQPPPQIEPPDVDTTPAPDQAPPDQAPPPRAAAVSGRWRLTNRIQSTSYPAYQGMRLGYDLTLRQDGDRITGVGSKASENGTPLPDGQGSAIAVNGSIEGDTVVLHFTERGSERTSVGTFRWKLSPDGRNLYGRFSSDAAAANGTSTARRQ